MINVPPIESPRLMLVSMSPTFLEACLAGDREAASDLIGLDVPQEWLDERWLIELRFDQLQRDPAIQPWLLRAIGLRATREMIGHIGFHGRPDAEGVRPLAPGGVELGYSVFAPFQRRGYATEACTTLMDWAHHEHQIIRFVVSISPTNVPSLRIAQHFGFRKVGTQIDEIDGPEDVFVRDLADQA